MVDEDGERVAILLRIENHGPMVARHHATSVEAEPPKDAEDFDPATTPGEGMDGDGVADEDLLMRSSGES